MFITCFCNVQLLCHAQDRSVVRSMIERVLPGKSNAFSIRYINKENDHDVFELSGNSNKIIISGNNNISLAKAFYYYLVNYCHASLSCTGNQLQLPAVLPAVNGTIRKVSPYKYRFFLNYCTFSYTMAFWDWAMWEKELDWMAMHGVNLCLSITGQEAVWQNTLKQLGYNDAGIKAFIGGPAFTAWWLMGNLEGWGGPVPQHWIDEQKELQKKIVARMRELGMQPVLQGFYGMVPNSFRQKYPAANIHDPGEWLGFKRPAMLMPADSLFAPVAKIYYEEQGKLYGAAHYYQGDPFHEGGNIAGVELPAAGSGIYKAMQQYQPGAVWVLQNWQENPRQAMLQDIPVGQALIVNIMAEAKPQWGGKVKYWPERPGGFGPHDWIWSEIPNFGGRTGMTAKLDSTNFDIAEALDRSSTLKGIGIAPEAIGQDAVLYDLLYDLAWEKDTIDLQKWLNNYLYSRYGTPNPGMAKAWDILRHTVYNSTYGKKDPPIESIVCARPAWNRQSASAWGMGTLDYDPAALLPAWRQAVNAIPSLSSSDAFQYDAVNITRQVLDNYARTLYAQMQVAFRQKDLISFKKLSRSFLGLIADEDELLATRKEYMLGPWLAMAKNKGITQEEKYLYEWNARTQITTWTYDLNDVNDYACKEWSGLLKDYYLPRWQMFIAQCINVLHGNKAAEPDYFAFEKKWAGLHNDYPVTTKGDAIAEVQKLFNKYNGITY